jgi:hypothetical protein
MYYVLDTKLIATVGSLNRLYVTSNAFSGRKQWLLRLYEVPAY